MAWDSLATTRRRGSNKHNLERAQDEIRLILIDTGEASIAAIQRHFMHAGLGTLEAQWC